MSVIFEEVSFSYPHGADVLRSLSFRLQPSDVLLVVGHNGAGKSSMLKLLNAINRPTAGNVLISGTSTKDQSTAELARLVSVTFQNPSDQIFASSVLKETEYGPKNLKRPDPRTLALRALQMFMLDSLADVHPYDLSFSKRKLLTLASAVAMQTSVLAFDEPSVSLSQPERVGLLRALQELRHQGRTMLIVSHDLELFLPVSTGVLILNRGFASFFGKPEDLFHHNKELRAAGVRLPLSSRLRPYAGFPYIPVSVR